MRPPFFPVVTEVHERSEISEVLPGKLYITNWRGAADVGEVSRRGITHVAAVGAEFVDDVDPAGSLTYWTKDIVDDEDEAEKMIPILHEGTDFIHAALTSGGVVLVHCAAGASRSATIVLAYLLIHAGYTLFNAFDLLHSRRRATWPNDGFMASLISLEQELHGGSSTIILEQYIEWGDYEGPEEGADGAADEMCAPLPRLQRCATNVESENVNEGGAAVCRPRPQALEDVGSMGNSFLGSGRTSPAVTPSPAQSTGRRRSVKETIKYTGLEETEGAVLARTPALGVRHGGSGAASCASGRRPKPHFVHT